MASLAKPNPMSPERIKAMELFAQGMSYKAAAKALSVSASLVRDWRRDWIRRNTPPDEKYQGLPWRQKAAEALWLHAHGVSTREICIKFGVSRETFFTWKRRLRESGEYDESVLKRPGIAGEPVQESLFD